LPARASVDQTSLFLIRFGIVPVLAARVAQCTSSSFQGFVMAESMSNSDLLRREQASFSNVQLPLEDDGTGNTGGELPFIVSVVDDLAGNAPTKERKDLHERKFDKVSRYNLDTKLAEVGPGLEYDVKSTLPKSLQADDTLHVRIGFNEMKDFEPKQVAEKLPPLARLLKLREQLVSLKAKAGNDPKVKKELEALVKELLPGG
jgi:type VI secretion system protein ImpB